MRYFAEAKEPSPAFDRLQRGAWSFHQWFGRHELGERNALLSAICAFRRHLTLFCPCTKTFRSAPCCLGGNVAVQIDRERDRRMFLPCQRHSGAQPPSFGLDVRPPKDVQPTQASEGTPRSHFPPGQERWARGGQRSASLGVLGCLWLFVAERRRCGHKKSRP